MTLPAALDAKDQAEKAKLSEFSGTAFDKAYMSDMVKAHREDVREFRHEARMGTNEHVKLFASETLPRLREHLRLANLTDRRIEQSNYKAS